MELGYVVGQRLVAGLSYHYLPNGGKPGLNRQAAARERHHLYNRGNAVRGKGDYAKAIADYDPANRLSLLP